MKRLRPLVLLATVFALLVAACGSSSNKSSSDTTAGGSSGSKPSITIGAQNFGENLIVAQVYGQVLAKNGYPVKYQSLSGTRAIVYSAFQKGSINFTPEYAASALEYLNKNAGEATPDAKETTQKLNDRLKPLGLQALDPAPAIDSNAFVVTKATADKYHLTKISDLSSVANNLTLGGPADCPTNPYCIPGLKNRYGIDFSKNFKSLDLSGPLTVQALKSDTVQVAVLFSTSGVINQNGWVVLQDDKGLINADAIVPVVTNKLVSSGGTSFTDLVNKTSAAITTEELTAMNKKYDIDKQDAKTIAADFISSKSL
jgi:osmoprotectant transport system substrate-binding protein